MCQPILFSRSGTEVDSDYDSKIFLNSSVNKMLGNREIPKSEKKF